MNEEDKHIKEMLGKAMHAEIKLEDLDEDFLTESDKVKKVAEKKNQSKQRRPCANCNCGAKDKKEGVFKSACGSCYLGDAFRCADCPYTGHPPFKPGEEVTFTMSEDPFNMD